MPRERRRLSGDTVGMPQTTEHATRYTGWEASPAVLRVHTVLVSAYCTLMLLSSMTVFSDLRETIAASLVHFR